MNGTLRAFACLLCMTAGMLPAAGAAAESALPPHIAACASLRRDAERLACYDKAVATYQSGSETATPPPSAENMFGANGSLAPPPASAKEAPREELRQITAKVTAVRQGDGGLLILHLDNDQVWRQQDVDVTLVINDGDAVTVQRAAFGTFRISDKRGRSARFKRVR